MAVLSILLLLALTDSVTGLFLRQHIYISKALSWTDAQTYCRRYFVDLSGFYTVTEYKNFVNQIKGKWYWNEYSWIGLSKKISDATYTQWSDGSVLNFAAWGNWDSDKGNCVFNYNNLWGKEYCTVALSSFCYTWKPKMIVVQEMKSWDEALLYCRTHYTDLISLSTDVDYHLVKNRSMEIQTPTFWTGLRFMDGSWFWVNRDLGRLPSMPPCPATPFRCGALNTKDNVWENRDCEEKMNFICYQNFEFTS